MLRGKCGDFGKAIREEINEIINKNKWKITW